jgi:uncharacterized protein YcbX
VYLQEIWIYPVKSLRGISLQAAQIEARGLEFDRRWMLTDESGRFMSQRELPVLSQFHTAIGEDYISIFTQDDQVGISVSLKPLPSYSAVAVQVWDDQLQALDCGDAAAFWFSEKLETTVRLVQLPEETLRPADPRFAAPGTPVSLADGYPFLVVGTASVDELSLRLGKTVSALRFRPNLIVKTQVPFEEDTWTSVQLGDSEFRLVKPCARCPVVNIDPDTGLSNKEVLNSLATFRKSNHRVLFGMNALWVTSSSSVVGVNSTVNVLKR